MLSSAKRIEVSDRRCREANIYQSKQYDSWEFDHNLPSLPSKMDSKPEMSNCSRSPTQRFPESEFSPQSTSKKMELDCRGGQKLWIDYEFTFPIKP
jgi:hypothetical protein